MERRLAGKRVALQPPLHVHDVAVRTVAAVASAMPLRDERGRAEKRECRREQSYRSAGPPRMAATCPAGARGGDVVASGGGCGVTDMQARHRSVLRVWGAAL